VVFDLRLNPELHRMRALVIVICAAVFGCSGTLSAEEPAAKSQKIAPAWSEAQSAEILDRTLRLELPFATGVLSEAEQAALKELLGAGERMHAIYLDQKHPQALAARAWLVAQPDRPDLDDLFELFNGPIATTLDNERKPFLTVAEETPARNFYPQGLTREEIEGFLEKNPGRRAELLDSRAVVRSADPQTVRSVLATLDRHPVLDTLHPGLRARIEGSKTYLAVPYSVAWADDILFIYERLNAAAAHVAEGNPAFARYLRLRARDLLTDDYEGGDAAWVSGVFTGNLNAEIGSYETYDDPLLGLKTGFALSILQRDVARSRELESAIAGLQAIENLLPYDRHKEVRARIPVGVYNVVADFGQARGTNTATILPNDSYLVRQYGRTILMRSNIIRHPELNAESQGAFNAAVAKAHAGDLDEDGAFYRTLWHEVGHYLGVDQTADGRDLDVALGDTADLLEEMKADLASLTAAAYLREQGLYTDEQLRSIYASGIRRVLQKSRPRRDQPYQIMQLIQWNWFLEEGLLSFSDGRLSIHYERYPAAVSSLLREVLAIQSKGDAAAANAFVDKWTGWDESLHGVVAKNMKDAERFRFTLVSYEALKGPARN
jgi:hypothetical protein